MNREELDAFFAKAEDVLTDWQGSADSMNSAGPSGAFLDFLDVLVPRMTHEQRLMVENLYRHDDFARQLRFNWRLALTMMPRPQSPVIISSVA